MDTPWTGLVEFRTLERVGSYLPTRPSARYCLDVMARTYLPYLHLHSCSDTPPSSHWPPARWDSSFMGIIYLDPTLVGNCASCALRGLSGGSPGLCFRRPRLSETVPNGRVDGVRIALCNSGLPYKHPFSLVPPALHENPYCLLSHTNSLAALLL